MRQYHKALAIAAVCSAVLAVGLARAYMQAPRPLTSADTLAATRRATDWAVAAAIRRGGLDDAESVVAGRIRVELDREGFPDVAVELIRPNDVNPLAAFYFLVRAGDVEVRFDLEGTRDPLLAIRLGLDVRIRADPFHPYRSHGAPGILAACVEGRFYHFAREGPDWFARLENRTSDPYHFGFETFIVEEDRIAVDHAFLETEKWGLDGAHLERYGLP